MKPASQPPTVVITPYPLPSSRGVRIDLVAPGLTVAGTWKGRGGDEPLVVLPDAKGHAAWYVWPRQLHDQNRNQHDLLRLIPAPEDSQRLILQHAKKRYGLPALLASLGASKSSKPTSKRTWEGWEQGRPMPFHKLCLLLRAIQPERAWHAGQQAEEQAEE